MPEDPTDPTHSKPEEPIPCNEITRPPYELTASLTAEQFEAIHAHYVTQAAAQANDGFRRGFDQGKLESERVEKGA